MAEQTPNTFPCPIVGIGASAGGIEALQNFFEALPDQLGVAFVVIIHLDPERRSELAPILARKTGMPVEEVNGTAPLEADHVYVIPPDRLLQITNAEVSAFPFEQPRDRRASIDLFFRSLAEQYGDGYSIILSGSGSDGAVGVKAVKEQGGLILVQDPHEAAFDGMPRAAIATGLVDLVLPVHDLAHRLAELIRNQHRIQETLDATQPLKNDDETALGRILAHLHARTGHDFTHYKRTTVLRRLARRMRVHRQETLNDYFAFLRHNAEEGQALFDELLISVTTFFRDPDTWEMLRERVISPLFDGQTPEVRLRVWVPGCATGEEAYTLAILLLEEAERRSVWPEIQIFATDIDESALTTARTGRYPAAIEADVCEERLHRFFKRDDDHYRITEEVRDRILFAKHSLLRDPPFSQLDLISCRNLLIYLDREVQEQVFRILRYALRPGGYLLLGASESAEGEYFRNLDKKHHLFQARQTMAQVPHLPESLLATPRTHAPPHPEWSKSPFPAPPTVHRQLLEELAPPSLLVDEQRNAVHLSETAGRFLQPPGGLPTREVTALVRPELQLELRTALYHAFEKHEAILSAFVLVHFNGMPRRVAVLVQPRPAQDQERLALVTFLESGETAEALSPPEKASHADVNQLQDELHQTQTQLRASREEFETSNEELRAANEELQSINEEYRATAEELETSKEELQSINEELQTVNSELKNKLDEVSRAHSDLENLMTATEIATLFLDRRLRIHRFTSQLTALFRIQSGDRNRPITDLTHQLNYDHFEQDARQVLRDLVPLEREVKSRNGGWYLMRLRPYRTVDDRIDGVVVTFVDITERKAAEERLRRLNKRLVQQTGQLQEQDRRKDEFLALFGHELRNPLAAIYSMVEVLKRKSESASVHPQEIHLIDQQVWHLLRLVEDLLNITRISRGHIELKKRPLNLIDSLTGALDQIRPQIEARHHRLELNLPEKPLYVEADPERLTQIVVNLLSNAAHYTDEGGEITLTVEQADDKVLIRVRDTGIGIAPEDMPHLFEAFTRLKSADKLHHLGLGLGLALASKLAELHDGRLEAFSAGLGQGSEFTLRLPILAETPSPEAISPPTHSEIPARRILLIEDEESVSETLAMLLQALGHTVQTVSRGDQAQAAVREFHPELVFLDIGLPDMSGYEVARQLRQEFGQEAFRLVALTGYGQEKDLKQAQAAGFDRHLLKPAKIEQLEAILREC